MDIFAFREELVFEYERFSGSFTTIRASDSRAGTPSFPAPRPGYAFLPF